VTEALIGLAAMLALSFLRVPIAISMGLVGFIGLWIMRGLGPSFASTTTVVYETGFEYTLSVVPLFILMGNFVTRAGMSKELYRAAYTFVGHLRGGLAMATVLACAGFDPVWFGIIIVVVVQIGLISPPVGMNMFVVKSMLPGISTPTIFRGVTPFVIATIVLLAVLVAFPSISLVLPRLLKL
jgi:TRAP-type C4-dicarboxylate transport system permease large subunit